MMIGGEENFHPFPSVSTCFLSVSTRFPLVSIGFGFYYLRFFDHKLLHKITQKFKMDFPLNDKKKIFFFFDFWVSESLFTKTSGFFCALYLYVIS